MRVTCFILPVHYGSWAIDPLQIYVWPIIIWLVISSVPRLLYEGFDTVITEFINGPTVKMAVMAIIEEDLWIDIFCSTDIIEINNCLRPTIPVTYTHMVYCALPIFWS